MAEAVAKLPVKTEKAQRAALPEWRPFESLRREMDRLFDSFDSGFWRSPFGRSGFDVEPFWRRESTWTAAPAVDVAESEKAYEITAELPGMDEKNIEVKLVNSDDQGREAGRKRGEEEGLLSQRAPFRLIRTLLRRARQRGPQQDRGELQEGRAHGDASEESGGADTGKENRSEGCLRGSAKLREQYSTTVLGLRHRAQPLYR